MYIQRAFSTTCTFVENTTTVAMLYTKTSLFFPSFTDQEGAMLGWLALVASCMQSVVMTETST